MSRVIVLVVAALPLCLAGRLPTTAADMAMKAPVARTPPLTSGWGGPYVGVTLGAKWTDAKWTTTQLVEPPSSDVGTAVIDPSSPDRFRPSSFGAGGYAG